jgi:tRNA pseudouridine38-40 synthase
VIWLNGSLKNLKIVIAYEGTSYAGFQLQKNGSTIQGELQKAIRQITGELVNIYGAGRTDAGVHASGQVINFKTHTIIPPQKLKKALNAVLPDDILIKSVSEVAADFHARFSAISKTYIYRIYNSEERPLFERNLVYYFRYSLNLEKMRQAISLILGEHDFKSFQASGSVVQNTVRNINYCSLDSMGLELKLTINANGFLYHMVRNIVGTLILIGQDKMDLKQFQKIMLAKDRNLAGPTAPASGLCLEEVFYS